MRCNRIIPFASVRNALPAIAWSSPMAPSACTSDPDIISMPFFSSNGGVAATARLEALDEKGATEDTI
jgi:hypothetical protein